MKVSISTKSPAMGESEKADTESNKMFIELFSNSSKALNGADSDNTSSDRGNSRGERRRSSINMGLKKDSSKKNLKNKFRSSAVMPDEANQDLVEIEEELRTKKKDDKMKSEEAKGIGGLKTDDICEEAREKDIDEIIKQHIEEEGNG